MFWSTIPAPILVLALTYLFMLACVVIACAAVCPQAIDALIRLLEV